MTVADRLHPEAMAKKSTAQARIAEGLREQFDWALEFTGMGETQFIEAAIKAFIEHVREEGGIWLPLAIVPKSQASSAGESGHEVLCPVPESVPAQTVPTGLVLAPRPSTSSTHGSNEDPAKTAPLPKLTKTRAAMRKEALKHKPEK